MLPDLPQLAILPTDSIYVHEHHDNQRTPPLIRRLQASGILRNPPIVTPLQDGSGRYVVLDGANRTTALRRMGFPHVIAQVVQPDAPGLELKTWNHVLWEWDAAILAAELTELSEVNCQPADWGSGYAQLTNQQVLALIRLPGENTLAATLSENSLPARVSALNQIVNVYKQNASLDRTQMTEIAPLEKIYDNLTGLIIFPHFEIEDILSLAQQGVLMPAGITRFTISPRALRTNYPLADLAADKPLEDKNIALQNWIQERLARKGVRYYAEATFLFDE